MSGHTPGPWGREEVEANIDLISAAPELLEASKKAYFAMKCIEDYIEPCDHSFSVCNCNFFDSMYSLKIAIAIAEGREVKK